MIFESLSDYIEALQKLEYNQQLVEDMSESINQAPVHFFDPTEVIIDTTLEDVGIKYDQRTELEISFKSIDGATIRLSEKAYGYLWSFERGDIVKYRDFVQYMKTRPKR